LVLGNNANVGIGTAAPSSKLDVVGGNIRTNQQLISTVATGTAPLSVSSTTPVSNLNADLLDGQHAADFAPASESGNYIQNGTSLQSNSNFNISGNGFIGGNVGIGNITPSAKLDVVGTIKITDGSQGANKVLTSDADGLASWQTLTIPSSGWSLTGNSGTVPGTNFIGTTDNAAFDIWTDSLLRTRITTKGAIETYNTGQSVFIGEGAGANSDISFNYSNVFIGYNSGNQNTTGSFNTANGYGSMWANTTGYNNMANGSYSLASNTFGDNNSAAGYYTLFSNTEGYGNSANGSYSLYTNTTGDMNTAAGIYSLYYNNEGNENTANGSYALYNNSTGGKNTAIGSNSLFNTSIGEYNMASGYNALYSNTVGYANTADGSVSLSNNSIGYNNTACGHWTLHTNTSGYENSSFGYLSDVAFDNLTNATAIGARALAGADNTLILGSINGVNGANATVNVGIGTTTPAERLDVDGNIRAKYNLILQSAAATPTVAGIRHDADDLLYVYNDDAGVTGVYLAETGTSWLTFSDARLKKNVEPVTGILDKVCQLNVKRFHMKTDPDLMPKRLGFIAQEVQRQFPYIVGEDDGYLSLSYSDFGILSVEAIKELRAEKDEQIDELNLKIKKLENQNEELKAQIGEIREFLETRAER
jgi:hypothetical protein